MISLIRKRFRFLAASGLVLLVGIVSLLVFGLNSGRLQDGSYSFLGDFLTSRVQEQSRVYVLHCFTPPLL